MVLPSEIMEHIKLITYEWPIKYPGLAIEYGSEDCMGSIYVMMKYNGFVQKRIFDKGEMLDDYINMGYIRRIMQVMRDAVIQKGEEKYKRTMLLKGTTADVYAFFTPVTILPKPKKIILNDPATIILWEDGTKTIVKKNSKDRKFDPEKGIALCYMKKVLGNKGNYNNIFKEWINNIPEKEKKNDKR